jgi:hypothetical protein
MPAFTPLPGNIIDGEFNANRWQYKLRASCALQEAASSRSALPNDAEKWRSGQIATSPGALFSRP